jgi:MFS family permease
MQFIFSPILGALSDRFGRRPVVLLSNFGLAPDCVLMTLAPSLAVRRSWCWRWWSRGERWLRKPTRDHLPS